MKKNQYIDPKIVGISVLIEDCIATSQGGSDDLNSRPWQYDGEDNEDLGFGEFN